MPDRHRSITEVLAATVATAALLAACTTGGPGGAPTPTAQPPASTAGPTPVATPAATSSAALVGEPFLIKTPAAEPQACMDALMTGRIVRHPLSGLGIADPNGGNPTPVEWPFGYTARIVAGVVELIDETGRFVAREGDEVSMGGGFGQQFWHACGPVTAAQV